MQAVWEAISTPGILERCHPFCEKNPVEVWPGDKSSDKVCYRSGLVYERRFDRWIEGVGYDLHIGKPGGPQSRVLWRLAPIDKQNCTLTITVFPCLLQDLPVAVRWLPYRLMLKPRLESYLESVLKGFEWYVTRGERVSRDQFGRHPWFSAAKSPASAT